MSILRIAGAIARIDTAAQEDPENCKTFSDNRLPVSVDITTDLKSAAVSDYPCEAYPVFRMEYGRLSCGWDSRALKFLSTGDFPLEKNKDGVGFIFYDWAKGPAFEGDIEQKTAP